MARYNLTDVSERYIDSIFRKEKYAKQRTRNGRQVALLAAIFLLGLHFNPEVEGSIIIRNVAELSGYTSPHPRR
jgi:hypothetical protein